MVNIRLRYLRDLFLNIFRALNYGMVGLVVGHEIMHAFDDSGILLYISSQLRFKTKKYVHEIIGRMYDKRGNRRQWWTQETMETFSKKAECFVQQYNNYNLTVLGNRVKVRYQKFYFILRKVVTFYLRQN